MEGRKDQHRKHERLQALIEPICQAHGVALYDARLQPGKGEVILRVLIERVQPGTSGPEGTGGGVTLEDCQLVSRDLSAALDADEASAPPGNYRLEVGSPGLDRPLYTQKQFQRFAGQEAQLQTRVPVANRRSFRGRLLGVSDGSVRVEQDGQPVELPHSQIVKANLVYKF